MLDALTLDQLRAFVAVAEAGSFRASARHLSRVQSAISYSVGNLEAQLGVALFDRSGHRPQLTPQGRSLLADARTILLKVEAMRARARGLGEGVELELSIMADSLYPMPWIIAALHAIRRSYVGVNIRLEVLPLGGPPAAIQDGRVTLGILAGEELTDSRIELEAVLAARRSDEIEALAASINERDGQAVAVAGDVRDEGYAEVLVERALKEFGALDGAFNNAGIVGQMGSVPEMEPGNWHDVIAVNLTAAFLAAKAQIPAMRKNGQGSIVFTSSFVGFSNGGLPGMGAYAASKAGMIGLVQSLASDHAAEGIRVNALLPGGTITPSGGEGNPEALDFIAGLHPMKRMARPAEIAQAALFLLSDRSSFLTGSPLVADGGMSVRLT